MELILNLAWAALAAFMVMLWIRFGPRDGSSRCGQLIALAVLVLILFPVISVSDDLQTVQNAAEADCCLRRDHVPDSGHCDLPALAAIVRPAWAMPAQSAARRAVQDDLSGPIQDHPGLTAIDNRPPPAA